MRVYVSGSIWEAGRVYEVMKHLEQAGYRITLDWTDREWDGEENRAELARKERTAASVADVGVLVFPREERKLVGAYIEAGMILARGKPLVLLVEEDSWCQRSIFWRLPEVHVARSLEDLPDAIAYANRFPLRGNGIHLDRR